MRKLALIALGLLLAAATPVAAESGSGPARPGRAASGRIEKRTASSPTARWVPGTVLVRWRRGVSPARSRAVAAAVQARVVDRVGFGEIDVLRTQEPVLEAVDRLESNPSVAAAQPDYLLFPAAEPNDPRFEAQWGLFNSGQPHPVTDSAVPKAGVPGADIAWQPTSGGDDAVVAVLDSGVDVSHPDLDGNLWVNAQEIPGNALDDDGNGLIDDVHGWDFARDRSILLEQSPISGRQHGTHVAGIAAAETDNGIGIAGTCPTCRIMVLKFMRPIDVDGDGAPDTMAGRTSAELDALAYARAHGADVLNASFTSPSWSPLERAAFQRLGDEGTLTVAAAGNHNGDNDMFLFADFDGDGNPDSISPSYPASYDLPSIVAVAASNDSDRYGYSTACARANGARWPCTFTSWGRVSVDLAAPGVDVVSTVLASGYDVFDGTSMAAPHVAGVAGLVADAHPGWGPAKIKRTILNTVNRPASLNRLRAIPGRPVRDGGLTATNGRLNATRALAADSPGEGHPPSDGTVRGADKLRKGSRGRVGWPRDVNDVFRKRLRSGRRYEVSLTGPRGEDFDLVVYRPGTADVWQIEPACARGPSGCSLVSFRASGDANEVARFRANATGRYVFQVSSFFSSGRYRLRVKRI